MMKIALVQLNITVEAKQTNYERAERFIKKAAQEACDVVVLPELFHTGFSKNIVAIADERNETTSVLSKLAKEHNINLIAGFTEKVQLNSDQYKKSIQACQCPQL